MNFVCNIQLIRYLEFVMMPSAIEQGINKHLSLQISLGSNAVLRHHNPWYDSQFTSLQFHVTIYDFDLSAIKHCWEIPMLLNIGKC